MVTIIIAYTCHATAYNTVRFQERTTPLLCRDLESHYTAWGSPKATITQEANAFTLHLTGMCRYRFSSDELHLLQKQLAGLSLEGAYKKLRAHQGIAQARISLSAGERDLPTDSDQIMIQLNAA